MIEFHLSPVHVVLFDDADLHTIVNYSWWASRYKSCIYAVAHRYKNGKSNNITMHRLLMNAKPSQEIDHINGNGLDNRRSNLRFCSHEQNTWNTGVYPKTAAKHSRFKGVVWNKNRQKWQAQICINGKVQYLGSFTSERAAARHYNAFALRLRGAFAWLNPV